MLSEFIRFFLFAA